MKRLKELWLCGDDRAQLGFVFRIIMSSALYEAEVLDAVAAWVSGGSLVQVRGRLSLPLSHATWAFTIS